MDVSFAIYYSQSRGVLRFDNLLVTDPSGLANRLAAKTSHIRKRPTRAPAIQVERALAD